MQFLNECGQAIAEQFVKPPDNVVELSLMSAFDSLFVWWGKSSASGSGKIWRYKFSILCLHLLSEQRHTLFGPIYSAFALPPDHLLSSHMYLSNLISVFLFYCIFVLLSIYVVIRVISVDYYLHF